MSDMVYKKIGVSTPFLSGYRKLRIPIIDEGGNSAWPEMFPLSRIEALRNTVGLRHFSSQMLLEYVQPDRARLDPDGLHLYSDEFDARTAKIGTSQLTGVVAYWDPSGGRRGADGSVCVIAYRDDATHHVFIHDVMYMTVPDGIQYPLGYQCDCVIEFLRHHNLNRIYIETNGIGNALPEIMRDVCRKRGTQIIVQNIINNKNKEMRILDAIEPVLSTGRMHAHVRVQQTPLISEMIGWLPVGYGGHDDGLDAVAGAICAMPMPVRPMGTTIRSFSATTDFKI